VQYWRIAADGGCPCAMMCLGTCYYKGNGVLYKDWQQAAALYIAAANTGDMVAKRMLAGQYVGDAVEKLFLKVDWKKTEDLFRKSYIYIYIAAQGNREAKTKAL
jgi:TPR repeat protein